MSLTSVNARATSRRSIPPLFPRRCANEIAKLIGSQQIDKEIEFLKKLDQTTITKLIKISELLNNQKINQNNTIPFR